MNFDDFLQMDPYELDKAGKEAYLTEQLKELTAWHRSRCREYAGILNALNCRESEISCVADVPFIPVRLFKEYDLYSLPKEQITVTLTSSGTTGQQVSRVYIDEETSKRQKKVLAHIISSYIGTQRLPLLILDSKSVLRDRKAFGARGAGILGFSVFGRDVTYALDQNMDLDAEAVAQFLDKHAGEDIILFGYTYMIWQHFCMKIREQGMHFDFGEKAKLFHVGGWKKLRELSVDDEAYCRELKETCNISAVHNYYGMAEQLGSVYVECEYGHMHASNYSDIIIRNPLDFSVQKEGEKGIVELVSILPKSYPGHAILTEDEGMILGEDDCPCGRKGKYFKLTGRLKNAELRGCSDTYADKLTGH